MSHVVNHPLLTIFRRMTKKSTSNELTQGKLFIFSLSRDFPEKHFQLSNCQHEAEN